MPKRHRDQPVLQRFGANLKAWRLRHGQTRDQLGERLGTDGKNVYRLESGTENLTLVRVQRIADRLGLDVGELLREATSPSWQDTLTALGWTTSERGGVPVYDLVAAAGHPKGQPLPQMLGHVRPPRGHRGGSSNLLIAQVKGDSMEPHIPSGSWCLFSTVPLAEHLLGAVVLIGERDGTDLWAWSIKRVERIAHQEDGAAWLTLRGAAAGQTARAVRVDSSGDVRIFGWLTRVLRPLLTTAADPSAVLH